MHVVPPPDPNDPAQPVIDEAVAHVLRWGRAPRVVVAMGPGAFGEALAAELRRRELDVVVVTHATELHAEMRACLDPDGSPIDLLIGAPDLGGCAPYHAIAWARRNGFTSPVVVAALPSDPIARRESAEVVIEIAPPALLLPTVDRTLLRVLRRRWSERPVAA